MPIDIAWAIAVSIFLALSLAVTLHLMRIKTATTAQKVMQVTVIWLLPVIGAIVIYFFHRTDAAAIVSDKRSIGAAEGMDG